ncbi:hypothetical protein F2Q68_00007620 [Brassica cretica]|uniref:Uncharacterized protein n=1 Tax=Brassica cretica TaxID=69181 RepID=A0A8S9KWH0_BRACR|nr:hypothetical protein F2Q68_00007620 [Brassica cretica]
MVLDQSSLGSSTEKPVIPLRLSSHLICLLLSSMWVQSLSPHNMPQNYEAFANTYSVVLLFGRTKNSSNEVLVWSFQLAFSLRNLSLGGPLQPSRRRSLFTLATSMIIFSARAFNIPPLIDPFLQLVEDSKLDVVFYGQEEQPGKSYGSKEDDEDAFNSLAIKEQLVSDFIPIDGCPVGTQLTESLGQAYRSDEKKQQTTRTGMLKLNCLYRRTMQCQVLQKSSLVLTHNLMAKTAFLLSIDDLLHTVSQTTAQLGRYLVSDPPDMTYTKMAGHCEALLMGKQEKMSFMSSAKRNKFSYQTKETSTALPCGGGNPFVDQQRNSWEMMGLGGAPAASNMCVAEYQNRPPFFNPPASTPFDNFFKPVGSSWLAVNFIPSFSLNTYSLRFVI